jgi:hypothetical protein
VGKHESKRTYSHSESWVTRGNELPHFMNHKMTRPIKEDTCCERGDVDITAPLMGPSAVSLRCNTWFHGQPDLTSNSNRRTNQELHLRSPDVGDRMHNYSWKAQRKEITWKT